MQRFREMFRRIGRSLPFYDRLSPLLRRWMGERFDIQVSAFGVSVVTHLVLLLMLTMLGYAASKSAPPEFRTEVVDTSLSDFAKLESTELAEVDSTTITPVAGSFGPSTSAMIVDRTPAPPIESNLAPDLKATDIQVASVSLPKAVRLDSSVSIKGSGAEHVDNVEGAVDRVAIEILRQLEKGRTLVVWGFDASGSLLAERKRLAAYIDGVYAHIAELDKEGLAGNEALLTAVVAFGKDRKVLTEEPTSDREAIARAIEAVPLDKTGFESSFRTVGEIARRFGKYGKDGQAYRTMAVLVTDEVGDDEEMLEPAIASAVAAKMPVYVLGSAALFGRIEGFMSYTDPETKEFHPRLPVRQGPEAALVENIRMPFWYDGPQYDLLDAGFGPYALSRLAGATGGIYFITRMGSGRVTFDPLGMREYKPDWISKDQYMAMLSKNPLRRAVMRASVVTQQSLPGMPSLTFPPIEAPNFKDEMTRNQEIVARIQYTVDEALGITGAGPGEPTIVSTSKLRDHEPSRRWRAHYDLVRGRLMAMKIRCMEFNSACARMKRDAPKFTRPESNAWRLVPDEEIHISGKAAEAADEARDLLRRVVKEHPGTPWALLAQRELKDPFGLKWVEVTLPPPPKPSESNNNNNNNRRPRNERPRPAELPKL